MYVPPDTPESVVFAGDGGWHIAGLAEAVEASHTSATMIVGVHGMPDDDGRLAEYVPGLDPERSAAFEAFFTVGVWRVVPQLMEIVRALSSTARTSPT